MAMLDQPAARRHHRSRIAYAFGLLALFGAAMTLVVVIRDPALSSTQLPEPVPAPEITVIGESASPDPEDEPGWNGTPGADDPSGDPNAGGTPGQDGLATGSGAGALAGEAEAAGPHSPSDIRRSLFWSGVLGLTISLAGLGLVGTRRRMW
ncbi:hypothetical protein [Micromonospora globbae]|uniref:hypothetical protein n=1 Tax=Micromonospora globbae TaxID=1894969 RepID=UPI003448BD70